MIRNSVSALAAAFLWLAVGCGGGASGAESVVKETMAAVKAQDFKKAGGLLCKEIQAGRAKAKEEEARSRANSAGSQKAADEKTAKETVRTIRRIVADKNASKAELNMWTSLPPDQIKKMSDEELTKAFLEQKEKERRAQTDLPPGIESTTDSMIFLQFAQADGIIKESKVDGDSAQVDVDTANGAKFRWSLIREDGEWRIRSVVPIK